MKEILVTSSVLIVTLLVLRLLFAKKVRRTLIYAAWALVALRLLIPVQIGQLDFSVLTAAKPLTETVTEIGELRVMGQNEQDAHKQVIGEYIEKDQTVFTPEVQERIESAIKEELPQKEIAEMIDKVYSEQEIFVPEVQEQVKQQVVEQTNYISMGQLATVVWLTGVVGMAVWFAVVNLQNSQMLRKCRGKLDCDSPIPVYVSENVGSPCLAGLFRPAIYLTPESAEKEEIRRHVLTHELTHYRHGDHIWSLVRCICLCVYWFNPLVWVAAWFSRRDCELACDEGAIQRLGETERLSYGKALLDVVSHASAPAHLIQTATAMNETKEQLTQRLQFIVKKPRWSLIAAICMVLVCAVVVGYTATGAAAQGDEPLDEIGSSDTTTAPTEHITPSKPTLPAPSTSTTQAALPTEPSNTEPTAPTEPTQTTQPTTQPTEPVHPDDCTCNEKEVIKEPNCVREGMIRYYCAFYGSYFMENIEALGHDFGEPFASPEATCGKNGSMVKVCSRCGWEEVVGYLPKTGGCEWEFVQRVEHSKTFADYEIYRCIKCKTLRYVYYGEKGTYDLDYIEQVVAEYIRGRGFQVFFPDDTPDTYGGNITKISFSRCEIMGGPEYLLERALQCAQYACDVFEQYSPDADPSNYTFDIWLSYSQNAAIGEGSFYIIILRQ